MTRVLAIGFDAGDYRLLEKWMNDGSLPNLKRLRDVGAFGVLASTSDLLSGSAWFTFQTGMSPANHGMYNYLAWRQEKMTAEIPKREWATWPIFWRSFDENAPRAIVVDVPLVNEPQPFNGIEVIGWSTHDSLIPLTTYPPEFSNQVVSQFGDPLHEDEKYGPLSKDDFRKTLQDSLFITQKHLDFCLSLEQEQGWDLFLTAFAPIHRASHKLFDTTNVVGELTEAEKTEFEDALRQVYIASDESVGKMLTAAGEDTDVLVFSLNGIDKNSCRSWILQDLLDMILHKNDTSSQSKMKSSILHRLRNFIPMDIRHWVKVRLPLSFRHRLTAFWRTSQLDWDKTRAFSLIADVQGWVRINLKGREAKGIVEPGEEYEYLCKLISEGLRTFADVDTGKPIVKEILRSDQVFKGSKVDMLPDLIVLWDEGSTATHRALVSSEYGTLPWPTPGMQPEGRSGGHTGTGFLLVAGNRIKSGNIKDAHILDLAPTILSLLEHPIPDHMEGKVLQIMKTNK